MSSSSTTKRASIAKKPSCVTFATITCAKRGWKIIFWLSQWQGTDHCSDLDLLFFSLLCGFWGRFWTKAFAWIWRKGKTRSESGQITVNWPTKLNLTHHPSSLFCVASHKKSKPRFASFWWVICWLRWGGGGSHLRRGRSLGWVNPMGSLTP